MILYLDCNLHLCWKNVKLKILLIGCILQSDLCRNILWAYLLFVLCWPCIGFRGARWAGMVMRKVWGLRMKLFLVEEVQRIMEFWYFIYFRNTFFTFLFVFAFYDWLDLDLSQYLLKDKKVKKFICCLIFQNIYKLIKSNLFFVTV